MSLDPTRPLLYKKSRSKMSKCEPNGKTNSHNRNFHDFSIWKIQNPKQLFQEKKHIKKKHANFCHISSTSRTQFQRFPFPKPPLHWPTPRARLPGSDGKLLGSRHGQDVPWRPTSFRWMDGKMVVGGKMGRIATLLKFNMVQLKMAKR